MNLEIRLNKIRDRILKHRRAYLDAINSHVRNIQFFSLEGDKEKHEKLMDELETTLHLLWRFDRKLEEANGLEALLESLDKPSTGSTSK